MSRHAVTDAWLHRITGTGGRFTLSFFCGPKRSPILSDEWLPRERRDKVLSVPFIPRVLYSWFLTTWFNHHTVFHVLPSSSWAKSLCRHEILTVSLYVCLCLPPGKATVYLGVVVVFSWMEIKGTRTEIASYGNTQNMNWRTRPPLLCLSDWS